MPADGASLASEPCLAFLRASQLFDIFRRFDAPYRGIPSSEVDPAFAYLEPFYPPGSAMPWSPFSEARLIHGWPAGPTDADSFALPFCTSTPKAPYALQTLAASPAAFTCLPGFARPVFGYEVILERTDGRGSSASTAGAPATGDYSTVGSTQRNSYSMGSFAGSRFHFTLESSSETGGSLTVTSEIVMTKDRSRIVMLPMQQGPAREPTYLPSFVKPPDTIGLTSGYTTGPAQGVSLSITPFGGDSTLAVQDADFWGGAAYVPVGQTSITARGRALLTLSEMLDAINFGFNYPQICDPLPRAGRGSTACGDCAGCRGPIPPQP